MGRRTAVVSRGFSSCSCANIAAWAAQVLASAPVVVPEAARAAQVLASAPAAVPAVNEVAASTTDSAAFMYEIFGEFHVIDAHLLQRISWHPCRRF